MEQWILTSVPVGMRMSELSSLFERVLLVKRLYLYLQHDSVSPSFNGTVRGYLGHRFLVRWTGRGGPQYWPPTYPDLNLLRLLILGIIEKCLVPARS
jgi:hypothetical protein